MYELKLETHFNVISKVSSCSAATAKCSKLITACAIWDRLFISLNRLHMFLLTWLMRRPSRDWFVEG